MGIGHDVFGEAERHAFRAINRAAPAQAHQDICLHGPGPCGGGGDIRPRRMLCDGIEDPGEARPKDLLHAAE